MKHSHELNISNPETKLSSEQKHLEHCHCGFHRRLLRWRAGKKLGLLGVTLFTLHFLFHVVECLILPAILVGLHGQVTGNQALAASPEETKGSLNALTLDTETSVNWNFYQASEKLGGFSNPYLINF